MSIRPSLAALVLTLAAGAAHAGVAVIVNPANGNAQLNADQVQQLFLGKSKSFPDGSPATPLDQTDGNATRNSFYDQVVQKNGSQLKAYWSKLVFTGKGTPPKEVGDDNAVKQQVATTPGAIGYIDSSKLDATVKAVFQTP